MTTADYIGSTGVTLLLIAYFLQMRNRISKESTIYLGLNFLGAALAAVSSFIIQFYPFVLLECVWAFVSLLPMLNKKKNNSKTI